MSHVLVYLWTRLLQIHDLCKIWDNSNPLVVYEQLLSVVLHGTDMQRHDMHGMSISMQSHGGVHERVKSAHWWYPVLKSCACFVCWLDTLNTVYNSFCIYKLGCDHWGNCATTLSNGNSGHVKCSSRKYSDLFGYVAVRFVGDTEADSNGVRGDEGRILSILDRKVLDDPLKHFCTGPIICLISPNLKFASIQQSSIQPTASFLCIINFKDLYGSCGGPSCGLEKAVESILFVIKNNTSVKGVVLDVDRSSKLTSMIVC